MLHMKRLMKNEIQEAALFIAKLNKTSTNYIGYCGTDSSEIFESLQEDFIDGEYGNVVVVLDDAQIVALVGFDLDEGHAEVWGPFCESNYQFTLPDLWHFAKSTFPDVKRYLFFLGKENKVQQRFVEKLGGIKKGNETYFEIAKQPLNSNVTLNYNNLYVSEFCKLHAHAFPNTYYSAETILSRFSQKEGTLLFYIEENQLIGYSYWEQNGSNEGHIEYMAVHDHKRGYGYGKKLLIATLKEMFKEVEQVTLTVSGDNVVANQLYLKTGFTLRKALLSYELR